MNLNDRDFIYDSPYYILSRAFGEFSKGSKQPKPMKKCLRKVCNVLTNHNGGYCDAECCKLDRAGQ